MIGQLLAGHYRVLQILGVGGFGQTYITEDLHLPGNPKCVLKHLKPASTDRTVLDIARKLFEKEAIVMQQLGNHDRIPRLLAYFEEQQEFYLVQEYVPGHPLSAELKDSTKWGEQKVIELLQEILDILVFIHSQGVIHRDIKPDNIMRRQVDRRLILIDFGAIKQVRNQHAQNAQQTMTVAIGTPGYMPIEQASGNPRASSDLFALGSIAIQALTGVNPYDLASDDRTGELKWEHLTAANPHLIAIVQRMTRYHFKDRYLTATEALQALAGLMGGESSQSKRVMLAGAAPQTYVQTPPPRESQAKTVAPKTKLATPAGSQAQALAPPPTRSYFPIVAGIATIAAAVASFVWFSTRIITQRDFATDVKSELCRIATPTDLPSTRVRSQPQRDAKIQVSLARGTKVVYLAEQDAFIQIQMADRSTGWVFNNQVGSCNAPVATPSPKPTPAATKPPTPIPVPTPKVERPPAVAPTPTITPTPTPSVTPTPNPSESPTPIEVPTPSSSPTPTPTTTPSSPIPTPTPTPSPTPSVIPAGTGKPSETNSNPDRCLANPPPPDCLW
ncbi:serine/threonine protein kinase [Chamaesiphon sp. VAR_48_metabat_403]|uniref:serine/threonine protein kinase n=1 Tax=Chamaesiphon sp. VAR_48_metabat_403 TaxID=2964700 RepID=UPI00286D88C4|nr:serine/threonine protein kinase [Chamaesiphon sp. VAR_48_metabat_403]